MSRLKKGCNKISYGKLIAISNKKGGVGKTTTSINLSSGLSLKRNKVLLIDFDPQGNSGKALGYNPDKIKMTIANMLLEVIVSDQCQYDAVLHHKEGFDFLPTNNRLAAIELTLANLEEKETVLKDVITPLKEQYDYIIIDCSPSLGALTSFFSIYVMVYFGKIFDITEKDIGIASTFLLAVVGFMILKQLSSPHNKYHMCVLIGCILGMIFFAYNFNQIFAINDISDKCFMLVLVFAIAEESIMRNLTKWFKYIKK